MITNPAKAVTHRCGHPPTEHAVRLWTVISIQGRDCAVCFYAPQNAETAAQCQALGLPTIHGSARQTTWADQIRLRMATEIAAAIAETPICERPALQLARNVVIMTASAKFWIDRREQTGSQVLQDAHDSLAAAVVVGKRGK